MMTPELLKAVDQMFRAYRENDLFAIEQTRHNLKWWYAFAQMSSYRPQVTKQ